MTGGTAGEQACPRCGASVGGAPWCPACGLNLRLHTPAAPGPETAAPEPPGPPPISAPAPALPRPASRRRLLAVIAGVLVLGGAIAAVALLAFRSSSPRSAAAKTVVKTVADTVVVTDDTAATLPPVTADEMSNELSAYMQAYDDESVAELESLFAPDLVRRNDHDPVEHLDAALATYQQQFDELSNPQYQLSNVSYQTGQGVGAAEGDYVITSSAGQSQGRIGFEFVARNGFLYIAKIGIVPS